MVVQSVFRVRLEPGQSQFQVQLPYPSKYLKDLRYSFACLQLVPDFYNKQAVLYDLSEVAQATEEAQPAEGAQAAKEAKDKALVQAFDTGMVAITMDYKPSYYTEGLKDELMAILMPQKPGVLESLSDFSPFVYPPHSLGGLTFTLWRYSEDDKPIPLSWKTGATIGGVLVGKV
jgi:hypothetical protein